MPTIPSLLGSYIDQTYQRLVQVSGSSFADGLGNPISFGGAPFPYTGDAVISGSLTVTGSTNITGNVTAPGLSLDINTGIYVLGIDGTISLTIAPSTTYPLLLSAGGIGLRTNSANKIIQIGDVGENFNTTFLQIDRENRVIKTTESSNDKGIHFDLANKLYRIGDIGGDDAGAMIKIDTNGGSDYIETSRDNTSIGLRIDFPGQKYQLGDYTASNMGTSITVDDSTQTISMTGSVSISSVLNIASSDPLPTGVLGNLAVSGSTLYFYNGADWFKISN